MPTPTYTATSLLQLLAFWYHSDFFSFSLQLAQKTTARLLTRSENRRRITEIPASKLWLPVSCILKLKTLFFVYTALILALSLSVNPCPHITLLDTSDPPIKDSPLSRDQGLNVVELSFLQPDVPDGLLKKTVKLSSVCSPHSIDDFNVKKKTLSMCLTFHCFSPAFRHMLFVYSYHGYRLCCALLEKAQMFSQLPSSDSLRGRSHHLFTKTMFMVLVKPKKRSQNVWKCSDIP